MELFYSSSISEHIAHRLKLIEGDSKTLNLL